MTRRTAAAVTAAAAVVAFVSGCSKTNQGTATPTTTDKAAATAALWDPCTQISSDTLQKLGVDQLSKESGIGGVTQPGWKICTWFYPPEHSQSVNIYSTIYTLDDFKKKADNTDFESMLVNGRAGWKFQQTSDNNKDTCNLLFEASSGGSFQISFNNLDPGMTEAPCDGAMNAAKVMVPIFPR